MVVFIQVEYVKRIKGLTGDTVGSGLGKEHITALFLVDIHAVTGKDSQVQITLTNIPLS